MGKKLKALTSADGVLSAKLYNGPFAKHYREMGIRSRIAKQRVKTFLFEVPVIGERIGQPFAAHGLH